MLIRSLRSVAGTGALALLVLAGGCSSSPELGSAVRVPEEPLVGEVARFGFIRPGNDQVAVGPYAVASQDLIVHGACRSAGGRMTWKIFDNSSEEEPETADDVRILDQGELPCDGQTHQAPAAVGSTRKLGIFGVTGTADGKNDGESAWIVLANE